jgi:hypothetical protein
MMYRFRKMEWLSALFVAALGTSAFAQSGDNNSGERDRDRGDRRDRGWRGFGGGDRGRGDWDRGRGGFDRGPGGWFGGSITPEQRAEFYNRMVERYMERATETYQLTDAQRQQVFQRLEQIKADALSTGEQRQQERQRIWEQMRQLRDQRDAGQQVDRSAEEALWRQMRAARGPLGDYDNVTQEVEKLLPPEQVQQGHERREQRRQQWRRERDRDDDDDDSWRGRDGRRDRDRGDDRGRRGRGDRDSDFSSVDAWERYTRNYAQRYQFDASQQAAAQSILRDLLQQRQAYEESHRLDFAAAEKIEDRDLRRKQQDYLNQPVRQLFEQLKTKLGQLPTAAQRAVVEPPASTQPSASGVASTQPSDNSRRRDRDRRDR